MLYSKVNKKWFTLIEIMFWILLFAIILVWWFKALTAVNIWKVKLISDVNFQKQVIYLQEKIYSDVKMWWLIDFEEYFNRKIIWTNFKDWHYETKSWFWNFWDWWAIWTTNYWNDYYLCTNVDCSSGCNWCYTLWKPQRYWEYYLQFIDYDSNGDWWDEDDDGSIVWDDDDEYLWDWPSVFDWWEDVKELYLISWDKKHRTLFRWNVIADSDAPLWKTCSIDSNNIITWEWCIWKLEFLKLDWVDYWMDHNLSNNDLTQWDWIIDTWIINKDFTWWETIIAWSNNNNYWVSLFSSEISVNNFVVNLYPNKNFEFAWKSLENNVNLSSYVRLDISIWPSWLARKKIKWNPNDINFSTTVSLSDVFDVDIMSNVSNISTPLATRDWECSSAPWSCDEWNVKNYIDSLVCFWNKTRTCEWINGWTDENCTYTNPDCSCKSQPSYNADFTTNSPTEINMSWQKNYSWAPWLPCSYTCKTGYIWETCDTSSLYNCINWPSVNFFHLKIAEEWTLTENKAWQNTDSWLACYYECKDAYTWDNCDTLIITVTWNCNIQPTYANADFTIWSPDQINQTRQNTDSWLACYYKCKDWYTWNNCEIAPIYTCDESSKPTDNWHIDFINGPAISENQTYIKDASDCGYSCTDWYTWDNCEIPPVSYCILDAELDCTLEY